MFNIKLNPFKIKGNFFGQIILTTFFITTSLYSLIEPFIYKKLIDQGIIGKNISFLINIIVIYICYKVIDIIINILVEYYSIIFSTNTFRHLNNKIYDHFIRIKENYLIDKSESEFQTILNNDVNRVLNLISDLYPTIISRLIIALITLIIIYNLSFKAFLISLSFTFFSILISKFFYKLNITIGEKIRSAWNNKMSWLIQSYQNNIFIRLNKLSGFFKNKYDFFVIIANKYTIKSTMLSTFQNNSNKIIYFLLDVLLLFLLGKDVIQDKLSIGSMLAIISLVPKFYNPLIFGINMFSRIAISKINKNNLENFLKLQVEIPEEGKCIDLLESIDITDLYFKYNNEDKILYNNLNCSLKRNNTYVIEGTNGSGKTTLFKIITNCLQINQGIILINGIDLSEISLYSLRKQFHYLPQKPYIIKGTIKDNILFGNNVLNISIKDFPLDIHPMIENIGGLERFIEHENQLSGGEKQLIAILRMLFSEEKWILMDEPFSSMDNTIKNIVFDLINNIKVSNSKTFIIISHVQPELHIDNYIRLTP